MKESCGLCTPTKTCKYCIDDANNLAIDYWHEVHGDTRNWDYNRDDIEAAYRAGLKQGYLNSED